MHRANAQPRLLTSAAKRRKVNRVLGSPSALFSASSFLSATNGSVSPHTIAHHIIVEEPCIPSSRSKSHEISIEPSLTPTEIEDYKAAASTTAEARRWQVILCLQEKRPLAEIVAESGYRPRTLRQIAQRYRDFGPAGLKDGRQQGAGASPLLSIEAQQELCQLLKSQPAGGGRWTGPKVAAWIAAKTGKAVHRQRGWEYLRRLGAKMGAEAEASPSER